ncbi:MAG: bifunctional phosphoribosylaminoimidazolecarboxamide formyltransferase/IMP cyclohydrolase [Bacteroidota bacterium]
MSSKKIKSALISVYYKDGLDAIVKELGRLGITIYSTGGTQEFIQKLGVPVIPVEELTSYPSILGGRVKTLHPKVFGGILARRENNSDVAQIGEYEIPEIDLVIVDLYPFEETVKSGAGENDIIEKIDIGGISLIRAAAKNFHDVVILPSRELYDDFMQLLKEKGGETSLEDRKRYAACAFHISSHYDTAIFNHFNTGYTFFKQSIAGHQVLRYGENPHQKGIFFGKLDDLFEKLHGKELSYNNLLDIDAAVHLMNDLGKAQPAFAILKHNNACGVAVRTTIFDAWKDALAGDPVSAFGGILISNSSIDIATASEIDRLFFEVLIAPGYDEKALEVLKNKKNRILLIQKDIELPSVQFKSALNGVLWQEKDNITDKENGFKPVTHSVPDAREKSDLEFAAILVKHTKSNTIVLAKNNQLLASGTGQTSRVDALKQAIAKATSFGFDLKGAVMASDAFFPFPDCVQIAHEAGIHAVVQPGGSVKDQESVDYCNANGMAMVITGVRHFKH